MKKLLPHWYWVLLVGLLLLNSVFKGRIDLTADQRYSLSAEALEQLEQLDTPIRVDVFLAGQLPKEYQRLRIEVETTLKMMAEEHGAFYVSFIDPFAEESDTDAVVQEMMQYGLMPETVVDAQSQNLAQTLIFPWAIVNNGSRSVRVSLLEKNLGDTQEQILFKSIRQLEYQFLDALVQLQVTEKQNIAVLTSHQTSEPGLFADLLQSIKPYYNLSSFDLKALKDEPEKTLENLNRFDLLLVSNPKEAFTSTEIQLIDQYQVSGGKSLWMINPVQIDQDSLFNNAGKAVAFQKNLQLDELFFRWGIRFNHNLIKDLYATPIVMAQGSGNSTQYLPFLWDYYPLAKADENSLIGRGIGNVWLRFASSIDTLKNGLKKQLLINSSPLTKTIGTPSMVSLQEATQQRDPEFYDSGAQPIAVLLEGAFTSLFKNRLRPINAIPFVEEGNSASVIIADGNFGENQLDQGAPLELGYDKWTNNFYHNKTFLVQSIHYLLGQNNRIAVRTKPLSVSFLDRQKVEIQQRKIKAIVFTTPALLLTLLGLVVYLWRKRFSG
ncbi:MAG: gliding motility-associated ABC transporter substrate-binding protein GldG [Flavobacteriaceae bacterium]